MARLFVPMFSVLLARTAVAAFLSQARRFLIVSAPQYSKIRYVQVEQLGGVTTHQVKDLVTDLSHPNGLAVDQVTSKLFVADPDKKRILRYTLEATSDGLVANQMTVIINNTESRWVAVDGVGTVFFSDQSTNQIFSVPGKADNPQYPTKIYDGTSVGALNSPGGIAVDSFFVYWANKQTGTTVGSVARGAARPWANGAADSVGALATNSDKTFGVCLALDRVFYTGESQKLYAVAKNGGPAVEVSTNLMKPRGCAWDGDGTIFVADNAANKVYSLASNMADLSMMELTSAVDFQDPYGIAVFSRALRGLPSLALALVLAAAMSVVSAARP